MSAFDKTTSDELPFDKLYFELFAVLALYQSFPQFVRSSITKSECPDWVDTENEIGIEVSRAESQQIGDSKNLANQYLGKSKDSIPSRRIKKFEKKGALYFDEDERLFAVSDTKGLFDANRHINLALDTARSKLEKLNTHFYHGEENCLFLFLAFSLLEENGNMFLREYKKLTPEHAKWYNHIFLMGHEKIIHVDYDKQELSEFSFQEKCLVDIGNKAHMLCGLSKWGNGTSLFNIYNRLEIVRT